jgi:predicted nucleic acid-binding protein
LNRGLVLDTNALVVYLTDFNEGAGKKVRAMLSRAKTSGRPMRLGMVNWGELHYVLARSMGWEAAARKVQELETIPIEMVPVERTTARLAARIKSEKGLSYADCLSAALAMECNADLVTSDRDFKRVEEQVRILWV